MVVEFMTGATMFALINLIIFLTCLYLLVKGVKRIQGQWQDAKTFKMPAEFFYLTVVCVVSIFFSSVAQPKLSLDPVQNRDLIEYQTETKDVMIETPPARTEKLEGFTPLKKD